MALTITSERVAIAFRFSAVNDLPAYQDTLFMELAEWEALEIGDRGMLAQRRYNAWAEQVRNPPPPPEPDQDSALALCVAALAQAQEAVQAVLDAEVEG